MRDSAGIFGRFVFIPPSAHPIPQHGGLANDCDGIRCVFLILFCVAAADLVRPARQTRWTGVGCPIGKTMVTAERVAYFAIWCVCGDPCGWCDGAFFTCGDRSDAPRWCTRCGWRLLLLLSCESFLILLEHHRGRSLRTAEHCEEGHHTIFGVMSQLPG
ncbi:hypothetical protein TcCL_NonESM08714 [Trypanosoma cruzi]|nr:hypothetical protein TcCL_NonESM08714 [Trypanosoma cruzi]